MNLNMEFVLQTLQELMAIDSPRKKWRELRRIWVTALK